MVLSIAFTVRPVAAQGDERMTATARDLAVQGRAAYAAGDYERAKALFHQAYALVAVPTISIYEARCLVRQGKLTEAAGVYRRITGTLIDAKDPEQFRRAQADAARELAELEPRLARLKVVVSHAPPAGDTPKVTLDGSEAEAALVDDGIPLDPGPHRIDVSAAGTSRSVSVTVSEGERRQVDVELAPAAVVAPVPAAPKPLVARDTGAPPFMTAAFVSFGVGALGLGTGVVVGLMATAKHADARHACPGNRCVSGTEGPGDVDAFRTLSTVSTVGYVVGGVGAATGVTLLLLAPSRERAQRSLALELFVNPRLVGVRGAFQ